MGFKNGVRLTYLHGYGGESGIRTHGRFAPTAVFKTAALNRSAISPLSLPTKARCAHHYGSLVPGILPSTPSGPAACAAVRFGFLPTRQDCCLEPLGHLSEFALLARCSPQQHASYQVRPVPCPARPLRDSATNAQIVMATGISAPSSGSSTAGWRTLTGTSWVAAA